MDNRAPSMLKATLIGGAAAGFVAGLPLVSMLNCACCALVIGGGFLAAFLYSKECQKVGATFTPGNGAVVGLVAGLFYAITQSIVGGLVQLAMGSGIEEALAQIQDQGIEIPPEAEPFINFLSDSGPFLLIVMGFFFSLLIAAVFSTLGGLIGGAVFKIEPTAPAPPVTSTPRTPPAPPAPPSDSGTPQSGS